MTGKKGEDIKKTGEPGFFRTIFRREYDFEEMLALQADRTVSGVGILVSWLKETPQTDPVALEQAENEADALRHDMEAKLISSFSTPIDRQDIYSISRQMDYILNAARETAKEMYTFGVAADPQILAMSQSLLFGTSSVTQAIRAMNSDHARAEEMIRQGRQAYNAIEDMYIAGMADLFRTSDPMTVIKALEIYHHLRHGGRALRDTLDILHNALIDIA
jgi:hypothetical protein